MILKTTHEMGCFSLLCSSRQTKKNKTKYYSLDLPTTAVRDHQIIDGHDPLHLYSMREAFVSIDSSADCPIGKAYSLASKHSVTFCAYWHPSVSIAPGQRGRAPYPLWLSTSIPRYWGQSPSAVIAPKLGVITPGMPAISMFSIEPTCVEGGMLAGGALKKCEETCTFVVPVLLCRFRPHTTKFVARERETPTAEA